MHRHGRADGAEHAPDQHLHHGHRSHAEYLAQHQVEGPHRRHHHLQHAAVLLLDDRLHDHRTVDQQEHVEDHAQHEPDAGGDDRRLGLRLLLLRLVVAEGLHADRGLHLLQNLREVLDIVRLEFFGLDDLFELPRDIALDRQRRRRIDVKLHVVGVGEDVRADIEHAELVGQLLAGRFGREVRSLEDQLFAALQLRGDQPAIVDDGDLLLVAARILHDEHRGEHQADHQQGHEQRGDDEGFFADALVEFAPYDNADL